MLIPSKLISKVARLVPTYTNLIFTPIGDVTVHAKETNEHWRSVPKDWREWPQISQGFSWGRPGGNLWLVGNVVIPKVAEGKAVYIRAITDGVETLVFVHGKPCGLFTHAKDATPRGNHHTELLTQSAIGGECIEIGLESYAGHVVAGVNPFDRKETQDGYPFRYPKIFDSVKLMVKCQEIADFVFDLKTLVQLVDLLPDDSFRRAKICRMFEQLFAEVAQDPENSLEDLWRPALARARDLMRPLLAEKNSASAPFAGLIGHSHMDTAWQWTIDETIRKCARTFANALSLMEQYPEFLFVQSTPYHAEMMRLHYPTIWEGIVQRVKEGRWDVTGGMWIEVDAYITSGESMVRQFLKGQRYTEHHFGRRADTFWLPDTFGYSAAIPQIMLGCGVRYFLTTKLTWNETNTFPYDTFLWRGIDGSEVLTHFNDIHCAPDAATLISKVQGGGAKDFRTVVNHIQHKEVNDRRLISYGFGDGGGGPEFEMIEMARRVRDLEGCPRAEHVTVSRFMRDLAETSSRLPVHSGELYVEGHRGTLTQMHAIKQSHRRCEFGLRDAEFFSVLSYLAHGQAKETRKQIDALYEVLLVNEFHDILPGTSIPEVHDRAIRELRGVALEAGKLARAVAATEDGASSITLWNTLSWARTGELTIKGIAQSLASREFILGTKKLTVQHVTDLDNNPAIVIHGLELEPLSGKVLEIGAIEETKKPSPFRYDGNRLQTPILDVHFDKQGYITSLIDLANQRELRGQGIPLNSFLLGEDVPVFWDNWDIDADQYLKMQVQENLVERHVSADGPLQFRLRSEYRIGLHSRLWQDMIFHTDSPRIDFETRVEWREKHQLLKVGFDLNLLISSARHEIQYGHLERPTHQNTSYDRARFEVCQHKWTDLSENRYGIALLNDCKYGVSVLKSDLRLTLLKGGCHPDPRGDEGTHDFTYSLLPHQGAFGAETVIRPAYELNVPVLAFPGKTQLPTTSLLQINSTNIILEAIKIAEDESALIFRFYESERSATRARISFGFPCEEVQLTNLLEEKLESVPVIDKSIELEFRAFEIKTVKVFIPRHHC